MKSSQLIFPSLPSNVKLPISASPPSSPNSVSGINLSTGDSQKTVPETDIEFEPEIHSNGLQECFTYLYSGLSGSRLISLKNFNSSLISSSAPADAKKVSKSSKSTSHMFALAVNDTVPAKVKAASALVVGDTFSQS